MSKNEVDAFLGDLNQTVDDSVFENKEDVLDGFDEPQEVTEEVKEDKPEPFHKNPKFKKLVEQNKELSEKLEQLSERQQFVKDTASEDSDDLTSVLNRIIGTDSDEKLSAIKDFKKALSGIKDDARNEALEYFKTQQEQAKIAEKQAERQLDEAFESIEESYGVDLTSNAPLARKTRADFITFVQRIAPKNSDGEISEYPDFNEAFDVFKSMSKATAPKVDNSRAKDIASRSMSRSTETQTAKPTQRLSWDNIQSIFDK